MNSVSGGIHRPGSLLNIGLLPVLKELLKLISKNSLTLYVQLDVTNLKGGFPFQPTQIYQGKRIMVRQCHRLNTKLWRHIFSSILWELVVSGLILELIAWVVGGKGGVILV